jgi:hypothetical protein
VLVFTQTFWIREKILLGQKQFDHRADNALMDVVGELRVYTDSTVRQGKITHRLPVLQARIMDVLDTSLLDALIKKYVDYHLLDNRYYYAIIKTSNDSAIYRSAVILRWNFLNLIRHAFHVSGKMSTIISPCFSLKRTKLCFLNPAFGLVLLSFFLS